MSFQYGISRAGMASRWSTGRPARAVPSSSSTGSPPTGCSCCSTARGAQPAHAVVAGQGLDALDAASSRTAGHRRLLARMASGDTCEPGTPDALAAQWITERGGDPLAMSLVLGSFTQTPAAALRPVTVPALVVVGDKDPRGDTAEDLAASLGHGHVARVPGDHGSALLAPELTAEILDFLRHGGPDCFSASAPAG